MEISQVRRRLLDTIERSKRRRALDRRARVADARRAFETFLDQVAVPLFVQVANVLRAEGYLFTLHTPAESVRLMSDRRAEDFIELRLDTKADAPRVIVQTSRARASGVIKDEKAIGDPEQLTEGDLLSAVLRELEPFVER